MEETPQISYRASYSVTESSPEVGAPRHLQAQVAEKNDEQQDQEAKAQSFANKRSRSREFQTSPLTDVHKQVDLHEWDDRTSCHLSSSADRELHALMLT